MPELNWLTSVPQGSYDTKETWISQDFYTVVGFPDGQKVLHRFMEPDKDMALSGEGGLRTLAYLKHIEREVRYYEAGADWASDLKNPTPVGSSAYRWITKDKLSTRTVGNPYGGHGGSAVPYPLRTQTWERDSKTLTVQEISDWDSTNLGWTQTHKVTTIDAKPALLLVLMEPNSYSGTLPNNGTEDLVTKTLDSKIPEWLFDRVIKEDSQRLVDQTEHGLTGRTAVVRKVLNSRNNRVDAVTLGDPASLAVVTSFKYQGEDGLAAAELLDAKLSSLPVALEGSGNAGVNSYEYDENGFVKKISVKPTLGTSLPSLETRQDQDALGRPQAQYDADGRRQAFEWDEVGRLLSITPPGGDIGTVIKYHDDHLGLKVTRGAQEQEYRYNAYGDLVLERRKDPNQHWSHKIFGYDVAGRRTGETVWLDGKGLEHENDWWLPNLTRDLEPLVYTSGGETVCKKWGPINQETGERACVQWTTTPVVTTTTPRPHLYDGSSVIYDKRGRVIQTTDANGIVTTIDYPMGAGFQKNVTVGGIQTTSYRYDTAGRLIRIIDALGQITDYNYDASNRVKNVVQKDEAERTQVRTWSYNDLGWLDSLTQPESGKTSYEDFTVLGKPKTTNYNGKTVINTYDLIGRVTDVVSSDGTVNQHFNYDGPGGKGKLALSTDGGVNAGFEYEAATGRLSTLTTVASGQTLTQSFTYDAYGNRTAGNNSHGTWTQMYHQETGLPKLLSFVSPSFNLKTIVYMDIWNERYDNVSWVVKSINYGNGSISAFEYDKDQMRVSRMKHLDNQMNPYADWEYRYDNFGNLYRELDHNKKDDKGACLFDQYGYDPLNRLSSAVIQSTSYGEQLQQFGYDAFGNRTSSSIQRVTGWGGERGASRAVLESSSAPVMDFAVDPSSEALVAHNQLPRAMVGGGYTGAKYDLQGNLEQIYEKGNSNDVITMNYDALGRVIRVTHNTKGIREDYQYRADGLRTVIDEYKYGVYKKSRIHVYDDARQLVSQYEKIGSGALTWKRDILYLGSREAAEIDAAGMHVTQVDHLGSPRVVTGPTGALESTRKYLPFGELLEATGTFKSAKGYTNHEQTDESGLIYMQARFYVPWFGRFSAPDPARDQHFEETQSWNIYSYVQNNPVMHVDPTGMLNEDKPGPGQPTANPNSARSIENPTGNELKNAVEKKVEKSQIVEAPQAAGGSTATTTGTSTVAPQNMVVPRKLYGLEDTMGAAGLAHLKDMRDNYKADISNQEYVMATYSTVVDGVTQYGFTVATTSGASQIATIPVDLVPTGATWIGTIHSQPNSAIHGTRSDIPSVSDLQSTFTPGHSAPRGSGYYVDATRGSAYKFTVKPNVNPYELNRRSPPPRSAYTRETMPW